MPRRAFEEIDEVRLQKGIFGQIAIAAILIEIVREGHIFIEVTEIAAAGLVLQGTPMDQLGEGNDQIFINMPAALAELAFNPVKQGWPHTRLAPRIQAPFVSVD